MREPAAARWGLGSTIFSHDAPTVRNFRRESHISPFRDGERSYVAASVRDMTESRAISDALMQARQEAEKANRAKSRFLATASHDLRQPLQAVRLINASMQKLTARSPDLRDLISHQEMAIDSAARLLNALLDISRLESGVVEPQLAPRQSGRCVCTISRRNSGPAAAAKG